jgi:putative membrane protein
MIREKHIFKNPFLIIVVIFYSIIWIITAINPLYRPEWWLENYLVFLCWGLIALSLYKYPLSTFSYILIFVYLTFHSFGAHYGYNEVPFGYWVSNYFHFARPNVYDRIVHFLFGFMWTYPIYDILKRYSSFTNAWLLILPSEFILSYSALYELIEAVVAWTLPKYDGFVGLQGDIWDGYKDMLLAFIGSLMIGLVNLSIYLFIHKRRVNDHLQK